MNHLSVERIESGPAWLDKASSEYDADYDREPTHETAIRAMHDQNTICSAIRAAALTDETVKQVISTLACEMKKQRWAENDVEMVESLIEVIG